MMTRLILPLLPFLLFFVFTTEDAGAQGQDFKFAKELFEQGDYFRAITEARRFIFNNPESALKEDAAILVADAYALGGDQKEALEHYHAFVTEFPTSDKKAEVIFKMGKLYAKARQYKKAAPFFADVNNHGPSSELSRKAAYWLFLVKLFEEDQDGAAGVAESMQNSTDRAVLEDYKQRYSLLPYKSPTLAGTLAAIVPGAGHLYLGRKKDAFAAFLLNGIFIWGIVESFNQDNIGAGITLLIFEIGWYSGNIYSAVNSAHKHNRRLKDSFKIGFTIDSGLLTSNTNRRNMVGLSFYARF